MDENDALKTLQGVGAVITDSHIVYTSGKHGSAYINKDALYPHTRETAILCREIATHYEDDGIEAVIAPAVGGVILATWTAYNLSLKTGRDVLCTYADKDGADGFIIKRGYNKLIANKIVLVVEDLLTTGGSVRKVVATVRACNGDVAGVGVLCNRDGVTPADIGDVPRLVALTDVKMDAWDEADCPLCKQGVPINTSIGHWREFLKQKTK